MKYSYFYTLLFALFSLNALDQSDAAHLDSALTDFSLKVSADKQHDVMPKPHYFRTITYSDLTAEEMAELQELKAARIAAIDKLFPAIRSQAEYKRRLAHFQKSPLAAPEISIIDVALDECSDQMLPAYVLCLAREQKNINDYKAEHAS